ncbi:pyruvate formate-lyase-activating protein [Pelagibaculum spongiae]|uniref:Pyruvate formate-lyase-activating enzyme n=1 Tax=Pelagibaculum spongiae TaxID=2080658 RepID=A0A2V1GQS5_9GAMM|nr:pyruvate formate-lyase-activating protein [Pelagibaculum spongiae]PVZ66418.1 pyruvate formate lyase-activating protein [Pelagibaculum spongiae]
MIKGRVYSTESFGAVDGPGVRFIAFLQGCHMRCKYCHNRDSWDRKGGEERDVESLMSEIISIKPFLRKGGVTVSGGEPLLQPEFVAEIFRRCHEEGLHTCLDTNGLVMRRTPAIVKAIAESDLILLDLKQADAAKHKELTLTNNRPVLEFAEYLTSINKPVWVRYVVVPGWTDSLEDAEKLADVLLKMTNLERLDLLPYHSMGEWKWEQAGVENPLLGVNPPPAATMNRLKDFFKSKGIPVS